MRRMGKVRWVKIISTLTALPGSTALTSPLLCNGSLPLPLRGRGQMSAAA